MILRKIRFVYNEPALIINTNKEKYLVVGDLHIGLERRLSEKGIRVLNATDFMVYKLKKIMGEFSLSNLIILGDVKDSILYPEISDTRLIKSFFDELKDFDVRIIAGNHDAHLDEILNVETDREYVLGEFGFLHGDKKPDEETMLCNYILTAHNHATIRMRDKNGAVYEEKVWIVADVVSRGAGGLYKDFNKNTKLIVLPAFNDLIMGTAISREQQSRNPLFKNRVFDYRHSKFYTLRGEQIELKKQGF